MTSSSFIAGRHVNTHFWDVRLLSTPHITFVETTCQQHQNMKRLSHIASAFALFGLLLAPLQQAAAQDQSSDKARTTIEIKEGKVFLNGKEVAKLEDAELPVFFKNMHTGSSGNLWLSTDDGPETVNGFMMRRGNADGSFRVSTVPGAYGFMSRDGDDVEVFDVKRFADVMEEAEAMQMQRFNVEVMADRLADRVVEVESAPQFSLYTTSRSMTEEGREADRRSRELARKIRMEDGDTSELEAELDEVLAKVFVEKQNAQQERIDEMRQKLANLEERLAQRQTDRADIIQKRKNELLGRSSRYDW